MSVNQTDRPTVTWPATPSSFVFDEPGGWIEGNDVVATVGAQSTQRAERSMAPLWTVSVHAPEVADEFEQLGLEPSRRYFAARAAPLGAASLELVVASSSTSARRGQPGHSQRVGHGYTDADPDCATLGYGSCPAPGVRIA